MMNDSFSVIPKEKFEFASRGEKIYDKKLESEPIGYFKDAWIRFRKNKSSVVAFGIIVILSLFAIFAPLLSPYELGDRDGYFAAALPKSTLLSKIGILDGTRWKREGQAGYDYYNSIGKESGMSAICSDVKKTVDEDGTVYYTFKVDSYYQVGYAFQNLSNEEYRALLSYQAESGKQLFYPIPASYKVDFKIGNQGANFWYKLASGSATSTGAAVYDKEGNYIPNYLTTDSLTSQTAAKYDGSRIAGDDGSYIYALRVQGGVKVRVNYYEYYTYKNGHEPAFLLGTNNYGQDILTSLALGARLSFLLAIFVSLINLTIGAIYGAIEGYYGGTTDLVLERISDILASVPFIVVATLFQLHLAEKLGTLPSLLFAFVMTGWVGMASRVRMQFYRYKRREYVLAAKTLGAKDRRIMLKHIFPNSIGTIITSAVLTIPGVIFTESMLSYLNIINLEASSSFTSIGTMLSQGQGSLSTHPHIILFPALFISLLEISFNLFGNGLRDAFNPSLRGVED
ncbi:MAG: ABC transporter permease [Clostridia bacterium]|nr:ABC transporter permease [Clostridia bacterium]